MTFLGLSHELLQWLHFFNFFNFCSVMDNTKEYVCRAVVTVVDHLGCVSANLNGLISETNAFSETELRIDCLKQVVIITL